MELMGIGSPLVDVVAQVEDSWLEQHASGAKGGMEMVSPDVSEQLVTQLSRQTLCYRQVVPQLTPQLARTLVLRLGLSEQLALTLTGHTVSP